MILPIKMIRTFIVLFCFQICVASNAQDVFYTFIDRELLTVTQDDLEHANKLEDIHRRYPSKWIESYNSTQVGVVGETSHLLEKGKNGLLTESQKLVLQKAEVGDRVKLVVNYKPKNNLNHNPDRQMDFEYLVVPSHAAHFDDGQGNLDEYLNQHLFSNLDKTQKDSLAFGQLTFFVAEDGSIEQVTIKQSTNDPTIDQILVDALCKMPKWRPARNIRQEVVRQKIEFYVSNIAGNCNIPRYLE